MLSGIYCQGSPENGIELTPLLRSHSHSTLRKKKKENKHKTAVSTRQRLIHQNGTDGPACLGQGDGDGGVRWAARLKHT